MLLLATQKQKEKGETKFKRLPFSVNLNSRKIPQYPSHQEQTAEWQVVTLKIALGLEGGFCGSETFIQNSEIFFWESSKQPAKLRNLFFGNLPNSLQFFKNDMAVKGQKSAI